MKWKCTLLNHSHSLESHLYRPWSLSSCTLKPRLTFCSLESFLTGANFEEKHFIYWPPIDVNIFAKQKSETKSNPSWWTNKIIYELLLIFGWTFLNSCIFSRSEQFLKAFFNWICFSFQSKHNVDIYDTWHEAKNPIRINEAIINIVITLKTKAVFIQLSRTNVHRFLLFFFLFEKSGWSRIFIISDF